ncbi:Fungal specific transcription factor [Pichia californica]|uniref:Fungal specific transcription factor n=1 Tax=Pichia californica TaxID=460514 RepID=A0A9P6WJ39_9ASCO|nr:Fungal specific transcription factor [[Candida] californica]KAG0687052.1 Fungal specific transcription factor [[Candida] californica]
MSESPTKNDLSDPTSNINNTNASKKIMRNIKNTNNTNNNNNNHNNNHNNNNINNNTNNFLASHGIPFDLSNWEDSPELNFLLDAQNASVDSPLLSNAMSPMNNTVFTGMNPMSNLNFINIAASGKSTNDGTATPKSNSNVNQNNNSSQTPTSTSIDYAMQLQHYQNLLLETQSLLNMKQMQQKSPTSLDQSSLFNKNGNSFQQQTQQQTQLQPQQQQTHQHHHQQQSQSKNQNETQTQNQSQTQNTSLLTPVPLDASSFPAFVPNFTPNPQTLLQQQILQLAQAQLSSNKIFNAQFNPSFAASTVPAGMPGVPTVPNVATLQQESAALSSYLNNSLANSLAVSSPAIPIPSPITNNSGQNNSSSDRKLSNGTNNNPSTPASSYTQNNLSTPGADPNAVKKKAELPQPRTKVRPCDHCRRRKIKCVMFPDGVSCKTCKQKGIKCTFNEATSLKRTMLLSEQDNKRMKFEDPTIEPPPNIPVRDIHPIKDYATMQGHSLLKKTLSLQFPRSSFYVGPTSIYDPLFLDKISLDKIDQFQINKSNSIRKVAGSIQFLLRDDFSELLYEQSEQESDTVEKYVAPHGQILINLYFKTVHPSFPVLHKKIFLEKYSRTHREFGAPLLAAVYLLAIQWWDYEPRLANFSKPDVVSLQRFAMRTFADIALRPKLSGVQAGLLLLQCQSSNIGSSKTISTTSKNSTTSKKNDLSDDKSDKKKNKDKDIEAQVQISHQNNWLLCTQVVGLAEELGLGLDCSTWRLPKWERGLRRRLAWAVYVQDKWSSLVESRPSHIQEDVNWIVKPLTDEDFPEKNSVSSESGSESENLSDPYTYVDVELGKESFKHTVSLSQILSEIQSTLYTPRAMEDIKHIDSLLKLAKPLQLKLRQWYHSLPKSLQMGSSDQKQFNANGNLQLSYFATEITLHRRIISTLYNQVLASQKSQMNSRNQSPSSPTESTSPTNNNNRPNTTNNNTSTTPHPPTQLIFVCRNAAKTRLTASIDFVRELNGEHLHSFWHSSAPRNFALIGIFAALLYVTSSDADEASVYREYIMDYRWILKLNSTNFGIAKDALDLIDGVVRNIPGLWNEYDGVSIDHINNDDPDGNNKNFDTNLASSSSNNPSPNKSNSNDNKSVNNSKGKGNTNTNNTSSNISKANAVYNYDLSNDVSPRTMTSPVFNADNRMRGRKNMMDKTVNSSVNTPTNSSYPPSPLGTNEVQNGRNIISRSKSKSPMYFKTQIRNGISNGNVNINIDSNVKTPTSTEPLTPTLMSQNRIPTPTQTTSTQSQNVEPEFIDNKENGEGNRGNNINAREDYDASDNNQNKGLIQSEIRGDESAHNDKKENIDKVDVKTKAEKLFEYDGQQSILNMTTALGITDEDNRFGKIGKTEIDQKDKVTDGNIVNINVTNGNSNSKNDSNSTGNKYGTDNNSNNKSKGKSDDIYSVNFKLVNGPS